MRTLLKHLFLLILLSAFMAAETGKIEKIYASDIGTKYEIIGPLGYRLGKPIDIEAKILQSPNKGKSNWLSVVSVDGKKLEEPIQISYGFSRWSKGRKSLLVGKTYTLRAYQQGGMVGIPHQAMRETTFVQTSDYHFDVALVIINTAPFVNSPEKAWLSASDILKKHSCLSSHGFDRETQDRGDAWLLIVKDKNPDPKTSCCQIRLIVNKNNGTISYEDNKDKQ
jgi:hypothetical protein